MVRERAEPGRTRIVAVCPPVIIDTDDVYDKYCR